MKEQNIDLTFIATNQLDPEILLDETKLFQSYLIEDSKGFLALESTTIDNEFNLSLMLKFLFGDGFESLELIRAGDQIILDLTEYKQECITFKELDEKYQDWIIGSGRDNNMDEYGSLLGIVGYVNRNIDKTYLVLIRKFV